MSETAKYLGTVKPCESTSYSDTIMIKKDAHITAHLENDSMGFFSINGLYSQKIRISDCNHLSPEEMMQCIEDNAPKLLGDGSQPVFVTKGSMLRIDITFFCPHCDLELPHGKKGLSCKLVIEGDSWQEPEIIDLSVFMDCPSLPDPSYINMGEVKPCERTSETATMLIKKDANITAHLENNPMGFFSINGLYSQKIRISDCNHLSPEEMMQCIEDNAPKLLGDGSQPAFVTKGSMLRVDMTFFCPICDLKMPYGAKAFTCKLVIEGDSWQEPEIYYPSVAIDCPTLPVHY